MRLLPLLLVACRMPMPEVLPHEDARPDAASDAARDAAPKPPPAPISAVHRSHRRLIVQLAITDDGGAAVSVDEAGEVRLWPALDGSGELSEVTAPAPIAIAIARDGDGFAVAVVDRPGGLTIVRVAANGDQLAHAQLVGDASFVDVRATAIGFLALRADSTIVCVDSHGASAGELAAAAGEHVVGLLSRGAGVLALVKSATELRGRWITPDLTWGDITPALQIDPAHAVLSPDHVHLASTWQRRAVAVDLATGTMQAISVGLDPLGYISSDDLAGERGNYLQWWRGGKLARTVEVSGQLVSSMRRDPTETDLAGSPLAVGDGRMISAVSEQLQVMEPSGVHYLGYQIPAAESLREFSAGIVTTAWPAGVDAILDAQLTTRLELSKRQDENLMPIDDERTLVAGYDPDPLRYYVALRVRGRVVDRVMLQVHNFPGMAYEPSTGLVVIDQGGGAPVTFYRIAKDKLKRVADLALPEPQNRSIYLVDPARAGGVVAMVVFAGIDPEILRFRDLSASPEKTVLRHNDLVLTVDRAARVFVGRGRDIIVGDTTIPEGGMYRVAPSRDASQFLLSGLTEVALYARDGKVRWRVPQFDGGEAAWTPDGTPVVRLGDGSLVAHDPGDGHVLAERRGWAFGKSDKPLAER